MAEKYTLDNGAVLLLDPIETSEAVSIGIWLNVGSRDEREDEHGLAHFTEHMLFKGTPRRSHYDIALEVDSVGGEINGATGKEHTYYFINAASEHASKACDILTDLCLNSSFDEEEFEKERHVILDEIDMAFDDPDDYVSELYSGVLWGREPFGLPVIGNREEILQVQLADLKRFYRTNYLAGQLVVSLAGKMDREAMVERVERLLEPYEANRGDPAIPGVRSKPEPHTGRNVSHRDIEQVYFLCGREGYSYRNENRYALALLNSIFGNCLSSRLFQRVRERMGLCYSIASSTMSFSDVGEFAVSFSTSVKNLSRVLDAVNGELKLVRNGDVTQEELETAKRRFKGNYMLAKESNEWKMAKMAMQELFFGRLIPYDETLRKIEAVSLVDVNRVAQDLFSARTFSIASVGPEDQQKYLDGFQFSF